MSNFLTRFDAGFTNFVVEPLAAVLFFDLAFFCDAAELPLVVVWLICGAAFFTLRFRFINLRGFRHAASCVRGNFTPRDAVGDISHFQALATALSATVGLGNIAGVAVAVGLGGPGAVFWMLVAGFLGMSSKFAECTLGQRYRRRARNGRVLGGAMVYLRDGLAELGLPRTGAALSVLFSLMCIVGSMGAGNMFQSNQAFAQFSGAFPAFAGDAGALGFGLLLAVLVGLVIVGGITRIGLVTSMLVPAMCALYLLTGLFILLMHAGELGGALVTIVHDAFAPAAVAGGVVGAIIQGFRRAAFSNEAGTGSATIAHAASISSEPVRVGLVALLEPFVDTLVVCLMTGLVIVVTGAHAAPGAGDGINMTSWAFESVFPWFRYVLATIAILFALSTMISWSYYGAQCWSFLFGERSTLVYKGIFLFFVWAGCVFSVGSVVTFSDMMLLGMAFPNIVGVVLLSGKIKSALDDYFARLARGEIKRIPKEERAPLIRTLR